MPNFNGKGPFGEGPMTGRGSGRCRKKPSEQIKKSQDPTAGRNLSTFDRFRDSDKSEKYYGRARRRFRNSS